MLRERCRRVGVAVVAGGVLATLPTAVPVAAATQSDQEALVGLAKRYLQDRAVRVTSTYLPPKSDPTLLTGVESTDAFTARTTGETRELDALRAEFKGTLTEFSHAEVTIEDAEVVVSGTTAHVVLTETTNLYLAAALAAPSEVPAATTYRLGHSMRFELVGTSWKLAADVLDLPQYAIDPIPYAGAEKSGPAAPEEPQGDPVPPEWVPDTPETPERPRAEEPAAIGAQAAFNRSAAIQYATRWSHGRNPAYNKYGNDCTNFLSQILRTGGWTNVGGIEGPDKWWHIPPRDSRTWRIANELARFGHQYSRRLRSYAGEPVREGDVVFADWADYRADGRIDHAMFVTWVTRPRDWRGIFVTYHTSDNENISMAAVAAKVKRDSGGKFSGLYYFFDTR